jgi:hypothetical protein
MHIHTVTQIPQNKHTMFAEHVSQHAYTHTDMHSVHIHRDKHAHTQTCYSYIFSHASFCLIVQKLFLNFREKPVYQSVMFFITAYDRVPQTQTWVPPWVHVLFFPPRTTQLIQII